MRTLIVFMLCITTSCNSNPRDTNDLKAYFAKNANNNNNALIGDYRDLIYGVLSSTGVKIDSNGKLLFSNYGVRIKYVDFDSRTKKYTSYTIKPKSNPIKIKTSIFIDNLTTYYDNTKYYTARPGLTINLIGHQLPYKARKLKMSLKYTNGVERSAEIALTRKIPKYRPSSRQDKSKIISHFKFGYGDDAALVNIGCSLKPGMGKIKSLKLTMKKHKHFTKNQDRVLLVVKYYKPTISDRFVVGFPFVKDSVYRRSVRTKLGFELRCISTKGKTYIGTIHPTLKPGS